MFSFFVPWSGTLLYQRKPHDARTPRIAEEIIWHASMIDTEGISSIGTPRNGVADAGASPAASRSVAEGSTAGAGSPGSGAEVHG